MSRKRLLSMLLASSAGALACHVPRPSSPQTPNAGVPSEELELLRRMKGEETCAETAEEVVDMQRRCDKEHWAECVYAATMYANGCGVAEAPAVAKELYQRGCSFGSVVACTMEAYYTDDWDRKLALLEVPCARGYATACGNLAGVLHTRGRESDVPRAAELLKMACDDADVYCAPFGRLVVQWKIAKRYQEARADVERACRAKEQEACQLLAFAYDQGSLGSTDPKRALAIYTTSCNEGHYPSCDAMGHMYVLGRGQEKDAAAGIKLFYDLCVAGYGPSCNSLGRAVEEGWAAPPDPAGAIPYYERACSMQCEPGCQRARELGSKR